MPILTSANYPAVRAAIDISLNPSVVPDATLDLPIYRDAAEAEITDRLGTTAYDDLTAPQQAAVTRAAIYLCAALLMPAVPQLLDKQLGDARVRRKDFDVVATVQRLRDLAADELAFVPGDTAPPSAIPTMFTLAPGGRARVRLA